LGKFRGGGWVLVCLTGFKPGCPSKGGR